MDLDFWQNRWQRGEIAFHLPRVHPKLVSCWPTVCPDSVSTVFVPLCGKSLDLSWLLQRGHTVIAVESSELAVQAFFAEQNWQPTIEKQGGFLVYRHQALTLYCGDYFALTPACLANCERVYDRAALIALPPVLRSAYVKHLCQLLPASVSMLLITLVYQQAEMAGPPFSVMADEVAELFPAGDRTLLVDHEILEHEPRFRSKGLTSLHEQAWSLQW